MTRPIIAVMPLYDDEKQSIWMLPGYMDALYAAGALPMILHRSMGEDELEQVNALADGYLFTGGHDIAPEKYGEKRLDVCGTIEKKRDDLEFALFRPAYSKDKPVLGICRGFQLINVALGGTLYQDIPSQKADALCHMQKKPYDAPAHDVEIVKDGRLYDIVGKERLAVNTCHHQGIKDIAPALTVQAYAPDGLIEAISADDRRFMIGVQWHPEYLFKKDPISLELFKEFIAVCRVK